MKNLRNTIIRKAPPKAAISWCAEVRMRAYSSGLNSARSTTATGPRLATTPTMASGNTMRMPNTAIRMPHSRKRWRHFSSMWRSTVALTTALSKDSEVSSTASTATMKTADQPPTR